MKNKTSKGSFTKFYIFFIIIILILFFYQKHKGYKLYFSSIYEKNILPKETFERINDLCKKYQNNMVLDPKANGRLMYVFPIQDEIYSLVYNPRFIQKVRSLSGNQRLIPCLDIPIEYRIYQAGSYMNWHKDVQMLPNQLQYECVVTLENTSDSKTMFKDWFGLLSREISTEPNSLVIVRAKGVEHCVTETTQGKRSILKIVFCEEGAL